MIVSRWVWWNECTTIPLLGALYPDSDIDMVMERLSFYYTCDGVIVGSMG